METKPPDVIRLAEGLVAELAALGVKAEITSRESSWGHCAGTYGDGYPFSVDAERRSYGYRSYPNGKCRIQYRRMKDGEQKVVQRPQPKAGFDLAAIARDMRDTLADLDAERVRIREQGRAAQEAGREIRRLLDAIPPGRDGVEVVIRGADVDSLVLIVKPLTVAQLERILASQAFLAGIGTTT
jgi:hypothetical protein